MTLLLAAWVFATPPFAAPDEAPHYLRALGIANGSLLGPRTPIRNPTLTKKQLAWVAHDARGVRVPALLSPPNELCLDGSRDIGPRTCVESSSTGDYHPLPYLLPAMALLVAHDATPGLWLARGASALECLGFILLALALAWNGTAWSLAGPLCALSPMVLFVSSVINPNGLEVAASLALTAGLLRLTRDPVGLAGRSWIAVAVSGIAVVLSWQLGPVFAVLDVLLAGALIGRGRLRALSATDGRRLRAIGLALLAASALYLFYGLSSGAFHAGVGLLPVVSSLHQGLDQLGPTFHDAVGVFGALNVRLPAVMYWVWWALSLTLCAAAALTATRRERIGLLLVAGVVIAFPVLFYAWVYRLTGFGLQGRYVLPVLVALPMLSGELIARQALRHGLQAGGRAFALGVATAALWQLGAWWVNARHSAGEPHSFWFLRHARWSPPLGWAPWAALALLGTVALLALALDACGFRRSRPRVSIEHASG